MKKKILIFALSVICLALLLGVLLAVHADEGAATSIFAHTLALKDGVHIVYIVDQTVPAGAEAGVLCWEAPQESYTLENLGENGYQLSQSSPYETGGKTYARYELPMSAKKMTVDVYAVSYVKVGDQVVYSAMNKYSVLQYCYNKKGSTSVLNGGTVTLGELVTMILDYGALAQKYFNHNTDRLANADYYKISVTDGTLADGTTSGLFQQGETVTLKAPEGKDGFLFSCWQDANNAIVGTGREVEITVGAVDKTFTAVFATAEVAETTGSGSASHGGMDDPSITYDIQFSFDCDTVPAAGEEFTVTLSVESVNAVEITAMLFTDLQYDKTVLEFKEYVAKELTNVATAGTNAISGQPAMIPIGFTPNRVVNGEVFDLKFRVKDGVAAGTETAISMRATVARDGQAVPGMPEYQTVSYTVTIANP